MLSYSNKSIGYKEIYSCIKVIFVCLTIVFTLKNNWYNPIILFDLTIKFIELLEFINK